MMQILPLRPERGFTLIEMLVVLTVLSIIALLAAPSISFSTSKRSAAEVTAKARAKLRHARISALTSGAPQSLKASDIAPGAGLEAGVFSTESITYYADGSSSGATIIMPSGAKLKVDWLTGTAHDLR